ncbi:glycosyltransferase family 2 protein [Cellulophaga baltica]|uniref:glycosyltransferase family 2 protein n=1 Tax=Cellulophaga TaxID=104264 RepID=UPI001C06A7F0|nr:MULTISPECIES: glycosyltransferase family 2 protein [Cellulophaga]MBU2997865.1 glycosyltransferase family 2 protein [Cellulophaga baltica]MDO6769266.1 glycosyltransferase family 2 protein [Cellulophaga sp. 1_MG-2023]
MPKPKEKISALIITYNEIGYIKNCIDSILFADEIIVVDSYSTDGTYEYLANHPKVKVIQRPFTNFTSQKSFTLEQATNDWILFLDADEVIPKKLEEEITKTVNSNTEKVAFWFYRKFMFENNPLNYSGWQTDKNYRLFRKSKAKFSDKKIVHETLEVNGTSGILKEKLIHFCYKNYEDYKQKMLKYGRLKAKEAFYKEKKFSYILFVLKPFWKFFNHYILRLGILDGKKGLTICYLNALGVLEYCKELKKLESKNKLTHYLVMPL